jgi:multiple sugar transport system substrate-binding protein
MNIKTSLAVISVAAVTVISAVWAELIMVPEDTGNVVHVTYWEKWTAFERDAMKAVVDKYNATQGAKKHIFVDFMPVSGIDDKTIVAISGKMPPDIAGLSTLSLAAFADNDAIVPLDDFCEQYGIKESDYVPIYWHQMTYQNHIYALPTTPDSNALHYNRAEFKAAGLDPDKPPQTFEEMDAMSEKLTKKDANGRYTQFGFIPSDPGWWNWGWVYFFGGDLWNGSDKITCNSPENVAGFKWVASYSHKYKPSSINSFKSGFVFASPTNGFISGKEAMQLQGVWMYNFITKFNPKLDWAAAPMPHPANRPDLANMSFADADDIVIPVGAKHPKEAFDFIAFLQRQENMELLCMGQRKQ